MNHTDIMIDRLKLNMHVRHITHLSLCVMFYSYLKCFSVIETSNSEDDEHNHS